MLDPGDFLTAKEVAGILRLPRSTFYKLTSERVLPAFKVGKHWRYRREAIHVWIQHQERVHSKLGETGNDDA